MIDKDISFNQKCVQETSFQLYPRICTHPSSVFDESPEAIRACTAEQSFGNRSECESHKIDRQGRHNDHETPARHIPDISLFTEKQMHSSSEVH